MNDKKNLQCHHSYGDIKKKKKTKRKTTKKRKKRRNAILCHGLRIVLSFQLLFTLHRTAPEGSSARANAQGPLRVSRGAELKEAGRGKKKKKKVETAANAQNLLISGGFTAPLVNTL